MNIDLSQEKRIGSLGTPLGKDVLVLTRFNGSEGLSELFEFRVDALSKKSGINFDDAIGQNCSVKLKTYGRTERVFNGVLVEAQWLGGQGRLHAYQLVLRPWLWLLSHRTDCRIFSKETAKKGNTVPDIIKQVFSDASFSDFRDNLTSGYPELEYCVQYRETDLAFVSRLMESYGIYYYFEYSSDKHTLVLADAKSSHKPIQGSETVPFIQLLGQDRRDREHIFSWTSERRFRSGKVTLNDYDLLQPNAKLQSEAQGSERYQKADLELYDYPGKYPRSGPQSPKKSSDGDRLAKIRLDAEQALDHRRYAVGDAASLYPGGLFKLERHPSDNAEYLVVRASHEFGTEFYQTGSGEAPGQIYHGRYELLRSDRVYRSPLVTPKPVIYGPQTAKVVGKQGEEIDVDEHGRITVQFHWDRQRKPSRRARVAQIWSGRSWGGQVIPRIGQEVVVEFLEGDPDRPLVVGTVYNNDYKYPYDLPGSKTVSGVKSDSSKGGRGYNEFKFEDKKGSELIGMRAEKDLDVLVRHAETREIGTVFEVPAGSPSRKTTLKKGDDELSVESGNQTTTVSKNITIKAGIKIELIVGPSTIVIDNSGITINGPLVKIN